MQLNIDIEQHKSTLFLDFLKLLKKDQMINDFEVIDGKPNLSKYEQEVLNDISNISSAINDADNGIGHKKALKINL
ncbi:MAG: hypothetical protein HF962_03835 [Sulfurovum sp.]|nr:hypothetical protein [Sulfurovum sp.]